MLIWNLNTSHVKVNPNVLNGKYAKSENLNTSHVKVNHNNLKLY